MGCPANKVLRGCAGAALMGDPELARDIIRTIRRRISIPLTVKFRLGLDDRRANYLELGKICEGEGVDAVTLHARTARQMFGGRADWDSIRRLKESLGIPVSGNGDVESADGALALFRQSGCDAVMIGRAAIKNPWIFRQITSLRDGGGIVEPSVSERRDLILHHFNLLREREEERVALHKIRTFTGWYTHGLPNGRALRQRINSLTSVAEFIDAVEGYFTVLMAA
jgi:nifR3 family TIM-barrel protein